MNHQTEVEIMLTYEPSKKIYKSIEKYGKQNRIERQLNPEMVEKYLSDILIRVSETVERLAIGTKYFDKKGQKILKQIQDKIQNKRRKFPKLNSLLFDGKFMNLDQNQADVISDFVSIFSATVKNLKIDLTGNYLLFEGFNDLINRIPHDAPEIEVLYLDMQTNTRPSRVWKLQNTNGAFDQLLKLGNLSQLTFDFKNNLGFDQIFAQLVSAPINHTIQELNLLAENSNPYHTIIIDLELLSPIFSKFLGLESLKLDLTGLQCKNPAPFLLSMSQSTLKELSIIFYSGSFSEFTANEFMEIVCSSKHLKKLNVNFRLMKFNQQDYIQVFHMLQRSSSLETLDLSLQNNDVQDEDILHFSEGILAAGPQLSNIDLNLLNDDKKQIF